MTYDGRSVANFILDYCDERGYSATNLSLQKIVYFCHVWSLVKLDRPLVRHKFEAWKHGPVLQYLYREFSSLGDQPITKRATQLDRFTGCSIIAQYEFNYETEELLRSVIDFYCRFPAWQLREISHVEGGPWDQVWKSGGNVNPGMKIEDDLIRGFYSNVREPHLIQ
ncbi:Panacea domain-containing protein [Sneathiella sp.]|uniref:Panacea domain-containing protein n=1 Tax=Sneathiella sp. TaxID=1964365 RepID=UPI002618C785|nr:type II toxin-antitoxin system antitoxin SocA domain-containing protein [Sneathiella sp.]MDF2369032.1 DUF4065 domain-containing protein [Sneathiella sp.]